MSVTREAILKQLAKISDAERQETTTIKYLSSILDAEEHTVEAHLDGLEACELARADTNGNIRVTITGEELLELDSEGVVIIDSETPNSKV